MSQRSMLVAILALSMISSYVLAREYGPDQGRRTVSSVDGNYRATAIFIGDRDGNMHFRVCNRSNSCFHTTAQYDTLNDVKAGLFSRDSKYFAAAYHYGHKGTYTWIGIWSLPSGKLTNTMQRPGWIRDLSFVFAASQDPQEAHRPQEAACGRTCPWPGGFDDRRCTSEADICACQRALDSTVEDLNRILREDCTHPITGRDVPECVEGRKKQEVSTRVKVNRFRARFDQCRQEAGPR